MIYLLVDLKIVLAPHPSNQNRGWSEGGAYPREGRLLEQGRLSKFEVLWGALNRGNTVTINKPKLICLPVFLMVTEHVAV